MESGKNSLYTLTFTVVCNARPNYLLFFFRLFRCEICGNGFDTKVRLAKHTKIVHSDPVLCEICNKSYANHESYKKHPCMKPHKPTKKRDRRKHKILNE